MISRNSTKLRFIVVVVLIATSGAAAWLWKGTFWARPDLAHIVLISIDTCRADYLSCYGYHRPISPHIDQVAHEGILFRNAISPVPLTLPAHSSMLTGTNPPYHGVHHNADYRVGPSNVTLAELLKENGFATGAVVGTFVLDSKFGLDQGFDTYHDRFDVALKTSGITERRGEEVSRYGLKWLAKHHSEPFFLFLHYYDPHDGYDPPEPFKPTSSADVASRYAAEIAYTDACIGQVINQLKSLGIYDSTLIIITSDHGEALGDHSEDTHGYFIYNETVKVPLIVKLPGKHPPREIDDLVGIIDIVPTICHLIGIETPPPVRGINLSPYLTGDGSREAERHYYCESQFPTAINCNPLLGVVTERWKYIQTTRPELYDLVADPEESNNLAPTQPEQALILQDHLNRFLEEHSHPDGDSKLASDEQTRQRLESLGYTGGIQESLAIDQGHDDPKDFVDFYQTFCELFSFIHQKKYAEAEELGKRLIGLRPNVSELYFQMGAIAREHGDLAEAVAHFAKVVELKPDDADAHNNLGVILSTLERFDEAISHFRQVLDIRSYDDEAHNNLGNALHSLGRIEEALSHYQAALHTNPEFAKAYYNLGNALASDGRFDEAIGHYQEVLRIDPEFSGAHYNLANALASDGRFDEAIGHYQTAVGADPEFADAHHNLANALASGGRFNEAIGHYRQALRIRPDDPQSLYNLGRALQLSGRLDEAISHYREVIRIEPNHADAQFKLGSALATRGAADEALAPLGEALRLRPDYTAALNLMAWILATHPDAAVRNAEAAIQHAQRASRLTDDRSPPILDTLAAAYAEAGRFDDAVRTAQSAVELAAATGDEMLTEQFRRHLELYRHGKSFRAPRPGPDAAGR